jgi:hypothetical protein
VRPASSARRAPSAMKMRSEPDRERPHGDRHGQERKADFKRVVAEHAPQVQRAKEEHPEHPRDRQDLDRVRRCDWP